MFEKQNELIKSGVITLVGQPNVGKSTLLNTLLGQKISIVSPKPQTTRNRILAVINDPGYQIIMLDTPGLHEASAELNQEMVKTALDTLREVDIIVFIVDAAAPLPRKGRNPASYLSTARTTTPVILLINKIDLLGREQLLPIIEAYQNLHDFKAIIPISALKNKGTDIMIAELLKLLPMGPRYYPEDIPTDASERFLIEEIIREKVFLLTSKEIPYSTAVVVDRFKEEEDRNLVTIDATILIEKKSQKGIIIGKGGKKLRQIGTSARIDIERLLGGKVMLRLWVKIQKNWTKNNRVLKELGYRR